MEEEQLQSLKSDGKITEYEAPDRAQWKSKLQFLLSCMGYAIGIGNVWRFPYLCYRNGGGAFLVPYLMMLFLCGIPLFLMELILGQFSSLSCITMFSKLTPLLKGVGYAICVVNLVWTPYYNVVISYPLYFLAMSFSSTVPWENCDNWWNTENCIKTANKDGDIGNNTFVNNTTPYVSTGLSRTPADEFFHGYILEISDGLGSPGGIVWKVFLCNTITFVLVFLAIMNGVKSIGKVVYFTATFPFVILFILLIRGVTLPGAVDGIIYYISPRWDKLTNLQVWVDGASQIFYSLGPGWGGIINMASFNRFENNCKRDSILVPIINCATSIFAGFVVFSVLGFMSHQTGIPVENVATGGPSLAFVTYPEAISMLPMPQVWSFMFFSMLFILGIGTEIIQIEVVISCVLDEYPHLRKKEKWIAFGCILFTFICSIPCVTRGGMYVIQLFDYFSVSIPVILICILEAVMVSWIYGCGNFVRDVEFITNQHLLSWWPFCWKIVSPLVLLIILISTLLSEMSISYKGYDYPNWAIALGWCSAVLSILCIPGYAIYKFVITHGSLKQKLSKNLTTDEQWGPAKKEHRREWKAYCSTYTSTWYPRMISLVFCRSFQRILQQMTSGDQPKRNTDENGRLTVQNIPLSGIHISFLQNALHRSSVEQI